MRSPSRDNIDAMLYINRQSKEYFRDKCKNCPNFNKYKSNSLPIIAKSRCKQEWGMRFTFRLIIWLTGKKCQYKNIFRNKIVSCVEYSKWQMMVLWLKPKSFTYLLLIFQRKYLTIIKNCYNWGHRKKLTTDLLLLLLSKWAQSHPICLWPSKYTTVQKQLKKLKK